MKNISFIFTSLLIWVGMSTASAAILPGLTQGFPDLATQGLIAVYDTGTGDVSFTKDVFSTAQLTEASGATSTLYPNLGFEFSYSLVGNVNTGANFFASTTDGKVNLAGNVVEFAEASGGVLEFLVNLTTSNGTVDFGNTLGIIFSGVGTTFGVQADNFAVASPSGDVPTPATIFLVLVGLAGFLSRKRWLV